MDSRNPVFNAAFADRNIQDAGDDEKGHRDRLTAEWWNSLPGHRCGQGFKSFVPDYRSSPIPLETIAFERWMNRSKIGFHDLEFGVYRIK